VFSLRRIPIVIVAIAAALHLGSGGASAQAAAAPPEPCPILPFAPTGEPGAIASTETGRWCFDGITGDRVRVRVIKTGGAGFTPVVEVRRPDGTKLCGPTTAAELTCRLDATGLHRILLRDYSGTNGGGYKVSIQRLNDPVGCARLEYATTAAAGAIAPHDETDCWRFDGTAGDSLLMRVNKTAGAGFTPRTELLRPDGRSYCEGSSGGRLQLGCRLDTTGTHTILVRDVAGTNSGEYTLSIQRMNDPVGCGRLEFATTATAGAILPPAETDCWRIDGAAGDLVRVRVIKTAGVSFTPRVELLNPNGDSHCGVTATGELTCRLDMSGTHTILVDGTNGGEYKVSIQRLNDPVGCAQLEYATTAAPGAIAPPDETDCWRFDGATGVFVRVRVIKTAGAAFRPRVELLRPSGTTRCGPTTIAEFTCRLDVSGTHTILVGGAGGIYGGEYRISIQLALEGEDLSGDGTVMHRSAASGSKTVWLHAGESRQGAFEVAVAGRYRVAVRYSNDNFGPLEHLTVTIDGAVVGECSTQDTGDGGHGWNVFVECDIGSVDLGSGAHALELAVAGGDGYGVEIDLITLTI
jgi:hypothetical protein